MAAKSPAPLDYDQVAAAYAQHRRVHPGVLAGLCAGAPSAPTPVRALEVGCGTGNYLCALHAQLGCTAWGMDPSIEMLALARARGLTTTGSLTTTGGLATADGLPTAGDRLVVLHAGRAEALPYASGSFDLLYSVDVIHHVEDRAAYVREAYRVLGHGGRMCTATDSAWIIRHRAPLSTYFPETVPLELARYPRIAALQQMMAAAGFSGLERRTVSYAYETTDIDVYRARAFSALHLISDEAFARGMARMAHDLAQGPIRCVARYTLLWGEKP